MTTWARASIHRTIGLGGWGRPAPSVARPRLDPPDRASSAEQVCLSSSFAIWAPATRNLWPSASAPGLNPSPALSVPCSPRLGMQLAALPSRTAHPIVVPRTLASPGREQDGARLTRVEAAPCSPHAGAVVCACCVLAALVTVSPTWTVDLHGSAQPGLSRPVNWCRT